MVWAEQEWVEDTERRRSRIAGTTATSLILVGGAQFLSGLFTINIGANGLVPLVSGFAVLSLTAIVALSLNPYRRVSSATAPPTVFHVSPAVWEVGSQVTLEAARCRKKQAIAEGTSAKRARLVFVFRHRPTLRHARGQTFSGRKHVPRYLYELQLSHRPDALYARGVALATTGDVAAVILSRQEIPANWRRS